MKLNHRLLSILAICFMFGCGSPVATTSLLTSGSNADPGSSTGTSTEADGTLDIQADNTSLSVSVDDSDKVEITGTCKDLDRKKNRILVEVFSGEDLTVDPYISNAVSDKCRANDAGLTIGDTCFWVTKGIGLAEDVISPVPKFFPQCHQGRFGFAVKLGRVMNDASPTARYTVRFKLRTLDGTLSDTPFSQVTIDRDLATPSIDNIEKDNAGFACTISMSPARFNPNITYQLNRTYKDAFGALLPPAPTYWPVPKDSSDLTVNDSVYTWKDDNTTTHAGVTRLGMVSGVEYTYSLTATDNGFVYPITTPTKTSNTASCTLPPPTIEFVDTTANTCFLITSTTVAPLVVSTLNPLLGANNVGPVKMQWGYSTTNKSWTGADGFTNDPTKFTAATDSDGNPFGAVGCVNTVGFLPFFCQIGGLTANTTHFFAAREVGLVPRQVGQWSNIVTCKTPP